MHERPIPLLYYAGRVFLCLLLRRVMSCLGIYFTGWARCCPLNIAFALLQDMSKLMRRKSLSFGGLRCTSPSLKDHILSKCVP